VTGAFGHIQEKLEDEIMATPQKVTITKNGIDLEKEGMR